VIPIPDPYVFDYTPPDELRDFEAEKRVTRACLEFAGEVVVEDGVLVVPDGLDPRDQQRIAALAPYLRWAAGLPATHWLAGGPANFGHVRHARDGHVHVDDLYVHEGGQA
jgi:hypothetical protein